MNLVLPLAGKANRCDGRFAPINNMTLKSAIDEYLEIVKESRSTKTLKTYQSVLYLFLGIVGESAPVSVDTYISFLRKSSEMPYSTQSLYRSALHGLFIHYAAKHPEINLAALQAADKQYTRRRPTRILDFDQDSIERILEKASAMRSNLEELRNRAFVVCLADSGLRIEEACSLRRGDVNWKAKNATVIGKGDKQAIVRFRDRSMSALKDYLNARAEMDGKSGKPLESLPLFARHDRGAGAKVKPVKPGGMWLAVKTIARSVDAGHVRVHDFRHYFVSTFYRNSRDLKATQVAARHNSIGTTEKYTHLLGDFDKLYEEVMER